MKLRESAKIFEISWTNTLWIAAVHIVGLGLAIPTFRWDSFVLMLFFYYLTGMVGITFGFHRLLTHRSFKVPNWLENVAAVCGTLACQGGPVSWVATHRLHHAYSDTPNDPHDSSRGFWWSHCGWLFWRRRDLDRFEEFKHYAPSMASRPFFVFLEKNMITIQVLLGLTFFAIGSWFHRTNAGLNFEVGLSYMVWGSFLRLTLMYNSTWFVNSAAHLWGENANHIHDRSKNNWWVAILAFGEGWHNNHHAQARSARHGWKWWQLDQTWIFINILAAFGLLKEIKYPVESKTVSVDVDGQEFSNTVLP